jgi:two-component system NtrC family sensor kinase
MHEINNPLSFISANLGNLLKFCKRLTGLIGDFEQLVVQEEVRKALAMKKEEVNYDYLRNRIIEMIEQSMVGSDRMKKIIQDVKSFSRLTTAGFGEADIHEAIDSTLTLLYHQYKGRIEIKKHYGQIPPLKCYIAKLNQVFMNLLVNAIQAIEGEGVIGISTGREDGMVVIAISDTGCGIPENILSKVFDPFFTTKPVGVGTGLGLSIIRGIIEQHKGSLSVSSILGQGTTFTVKVSADLQIDDEKNLSGLAAE